MIGWASWASMKSNCHIPDSMSGCRYADNKQFMNPGAVPRDFADFFSRSQASEIAAAFFDTLHSSGTLGTSSDLRGLSLDNVINGDIHSTKTLDKNDLPILRSSFRAAVVHFMLAQFYITKYCNVL